MPCVKTEVYIHVLQKESSLLSSNLQYCISSKSVCMKICKLRIKRPRGLIIRYGCFCKSFHLKINLKCKLIFGLLQSGRFLVKLVYKKLLLHCFLSLVAACIYALDILYFFFFFILSDCI